MFEAWRQQFSPKHNKLKWVEMYVLNGHEHFIVCDCVILFVPAYVFPSVYVFILLQYLLICHNYNTHFARNDNITILLLLMIQLSLPTEAQTQVTAEGMAITSTNAKWLKWHRIIHCIVMIKLCHRFVMSFLKSVCLHFQSPHSLSKYTQLQLFKRKDKLYWRPLGFSRIHVNHKWEWFKCFSWPPFLYRTVYCNAKKEVGRSVIGCHPSSSLLVFLSFFPSFFLFLSSFHHCTLCCLPAFKTHWQQMWWGIIVEGKSQGFQEHILFTWP